MLACPRSLVQFYSSVGDFTEWCTLVAEPHRHGLDEYMDVKGKGVKVKSIRSSSAGPSSSGQEVGGETYDGLEGRHPVGWKTVTVWSGAGSPGFNEEDEGKSTTVGAS